VQQLNGRVSNIFLANKKGDHDWYDWSYLIFDMKFDKNLGAMFELDVLLL
jgi:hypothetical protein